MKKVCSCSIYSKFLASSVAVCLWAVSSMSASAVDFVFDLTRFSEDQDIAFVQVTVQQWDTATDMESDILTDTLKFTVDQPDPDIFGDLRGLFFHINESIIDPEDLVFDAESFMAYSNADGNPLLTPDPNFLVESSLNDIDSVNVSGNSNTIKPIPSLDIGIEFGTSGASPDDIHHVSFEVSKAGGLDLFTFFPVHMEHFMAARIMSLQPNGGSSKLSCCGTSVPEPSSTMGLFAFAFGGLLWRRRLAS